MTPRNIANCRVRPRHRCPTACCHCHRQGHSVLSPPENPYDTLKRELIRRTNETKQRKLQKLLSSRELGGGKPTELLRDMRHLIGNHCCNGSVDSIRSLPAATASAGADDFECVLLRIPRFSGTHSRQNYGSRYPNTICHRETTCFITRERQSATTAWIAFLTLTSDSSAM